MNRFRGAGPGGAGWDRVGPGGTGWGRVRWSTESGRIWRRVIENGAHSSKLLAKMKDI